LHSSSFAKSSTSFGWGKGGKVTTVGWQVTLCDSIWHVISVVMRWYPRTAIFALLTYFQRCIFVKFDRLLHVES